MDYESTPEFDTQFLKLTKKNKALEERLLKKISQICQRRSKSTQIRRNESAQIYKYLPPSVSLTQFLNSYAGVSPVFFVP